MDKKIVCLLLLVGVFELCNGHGMLLEPVNRASRWRYDKTAPTNWNDNELFCGGFAVQWLKNGGKCGVCGDNWALATPRRHEMGGEMGQGVIVKSYKQNGELPVAAMLTTNHKGYFTFNLCNMDNQPENESCFEKYPLNIVGGTTKYVLPTYTAGWYNTTLTIPSNLTCKHCVLQWTYTTGNTWGPCGNGSSATGCGPQETFRTCSDISIE